MANNDYEIYHSNRKGPPIVIKENLIDNDTIPLALIGHGEANYGKSQNENFLHLLENFASNGSDDEPEPAHPVIGQLWFKNLGGGKFELNVCSALDTSGNATWSKMSQVITSTSGNNYSPGDLYYDTESKKLKVFDESQGWISVGPTDVVHTEHLFNSILVNPQAKAASFNNFDMSVISKDIEETSDENVKSNGSVNLVKMIILAKEFKENGTLASNDAKCCVWIYKFLLRSVKTGQDMYDIRMIGAPSYELVAQNPSDLNWDVDISLDTTTGTPQLVINFDLNTVSNNHISIGFDSEITRI